MRLGRAVGAAVACLLLAGATTGPADAGDQQITYIRGSARSDELVGTVHRDVIKGFAGEDRIYPRAGRDRVRAGRGDDQVHLTRDDKRDRIFCGRGFDVVVWSYHPDPRDLIDDSCEGQIA